MLLINILISISYCTVIGIDLGGESIKIAIGSPGKGVHRIRNYYLNDVTPNYFAYVNQSYWAYGEGAIAQCRVNPETCIQNRKLPLNNRYYFGRSLKGFQITAIAIKQIIDNAVTKLKIDTSSISVVIAIPPSTTNIEKSYLYSALQLLNINCVQFVTTTYAAIETYVNENQNMISHNALIIDIGHEGVRVSGFDIGKNKITQTFGQFNETVGGKRIDENLLKYITNKYSLILSNPSLSNELDVDYGHELQRNKHLLMAKIKRAREELSTSAFVTFEFKNINITLSRKEVDSCASGVKEALTKMINEVKKDAQYLLRTGDIHIIGGCSRIPCLQDHIKKLLPNINLVEQLKKILTVCKGACYIVDTEIGSTISEHNSLLTSKVVLKTGKSEYELFDASKHVNFNPVVQLKNVDEKQLFSIVEKEKDKVEREFTRFSIYIPDDSNRRNTVDVGFSINYFLMPIPDEPVLKDVFDETTLTVDYSKVGWEVTSQELSYVKQKSSEMFKSANMDLKVDVDSSEINGYVTFVNEKLKPYFAASWRRVSFLALAKAASMKFNKCVKENDYDCPHSKVELILDELKSGVAKLSIQDAGDYERKFTVKNPTQIAIHELNAALQVCKKLGAKHDDVENWMNEKMVTASINDINKYVRILKDRAKKAEQARNFEDL